MCTGKIIMKHTEIYDMAAQTITDPRHISILTTSSLFCMLGMAFAITNKITRIGTQRETKLVHPLLVCSPDVLIKTQNFFLLRIISKTIHYRQMVSKLQLGQKYTANEAFLLFFWYAQDL